MSKGDGWIQKKQRKSATTGKVTVTYVARFTPPGGKEESKSFKRHGRTNEPGTAAYWLQQQREAVRTSTYIDPRDREWTVAEWADAWLDSYTGISDETRRAYRAVIELDIKASGLGDDPILSVDRLRMGEWMNKLVTRKWADKPLMASTMATRRTVIAMIFAAAHDEQIIPRNPMRKVHAPQGAVEIEPIDPEELPTPEQVWHLYDVAGDRHALLREQIIVTAGTGLRPGELLGLRPRNLRARQIHVVEQRRLKSAEVEYGPPKSKASRRRIPIGDEVEEAIGRHLEANPADPDEVIFRFRDGKEWHRSTWADHWRRVREAAGLPKLRFYLLRHYYASVLIEGGASPKLVMSRMGHESSKYTLERYARLWHDSEEVTRELSDAGLKRDKGGTLRSATDQ
ncbi:site-specific integrase [Nocardia sp. NPDC005745]|uniref:tyrosine-type recombinase/integrase n=1 Tax=Nocardia sp. NPDC005745 TaxID=3157061 RepID=UPI0034045CFD